MKIKEEADKDEDEQEDEVARTDKEKEKKEGRGKFPITKCLGQHRPSTDHTHPHTQKQPGRSCETAVTFTYAIGTHVPIRGGPHTLRIPASVASRHAGTNNRKKKSYSL